LTQIARLSSIIPYLLLEIASTARSPAFDFRRRPVITTMISIPTAAREGTGSGYEPVVSFDDTRVKLRRITGHAQTSFWEPESAHRQVPLGTGLVLV
jgi:hypothetical protein